MTADEKDLKEKSKRPKKLPAMPGPVFTWVVVDGFGTIFPESMRPTKEEAIEAFCAAHPEGGSWFFWSRCDFKPIRGRWTPTETKVSEELTRRAMCWSVSKSESPQ